jgi:hypothetical protein
LYNTFSTDKCKTLGTIGTGSNMTIQLDWPPDVVDRLTEEARQKGVSLDEYLLQAVLHEKPANGARPTEEAAKRQAREEAGRSIRELRKGNILGPDLTIRDLIDEGRRF